MTTVAALFVAKGGCYFGLEGVDPYDEARDARLYDGPWPVVAHPPCTRWCQLARVVEARYGHRVGDDGGCFSSALAAVRRWGGVLEHPAETIAWKAFDLPRPSPLVGAWTRTFCGGFVAEVWQAAYGHQARKRTWLYAYGVEPLQLSAARAEGTHAVSYMVNHGCDKPRLTKKQAKATPPAFRDLLLSIARTAQSTSHL